MPVLDDFMQEIVAYLMFFECLPIFGHKKFYFYKFLIY